MVHIGLVNFVLVVVGGGLIALILGQQTRVVATKLPLILLVLSDAASFPNLRCRYFFVEYR